MKRKKFYILSDSIKSTTGNARVARGLLKGLKKLDYEVANIALGQEEPEGEFEGIKILPITQHGFEDSHVKMFLHKLTLYLERDKPHYFVILGDRVHYQQLGIGNIDKIFLDKNNIKLIFWETVDSDVCLCLENSYTNPIHPKSEIYKACHHVVTTSSYGKRVLENEFIKVDKVIWEFVDTKEFVPVSKSKKIEIRKEYRFRKDDFIFLTVGRCMRRKNHELTIEALYPLLIEYTHARLFCVIPGYDKKDDMNLADFCRRVMPSRKEYGNRDLIDEQKIVFCTIGKQSPTLSEGVSDEEMIKFHQLSDAFILGTSNEGFNLNFGEAMACGNPYIGSNNTTIPELTNNGEVGFIAPIKLEMHTGLGIKVGITSIEALREQARKVLELTEKEREELKIKNVKFIENQIPLGKCIAEWHKFLKSIEPKKEDG